MPARAGAVPRHRPDAGLTVALDFNINGRVEFKLTPEGVQRYRRYCTVDTPPALWPTFPAPGQPIQMQLWQVMEIFGGPDTGASAPPLIQDCQIRLIDHAEFTAFEQIGIVTKASFGWHPDFDALRLSLTVRVVRGMVDFYLDADEAALALKTWRADVSGLAGKPCIVTLKNNGIYSFLRAEV